jgi:hypothetical protein
VFVVVMVGAGGGGVAQTCVHWTCPSVEEKIWLIHNQK